MGQQIYWYSSGSTFSNVSTVRTSIGQSTAKLSSHSGLVAFLRGAEIVIMRRAASMKFECSLESPVKMCSILVVIILSNIGTAIDNIDRQVRYKCPKIPLLSFIIQEC